MTPTAVMELADARRDRIAELTRQGLPAHVIAEMLGCTVRTVQRGRSARGCVEAPRVPMTDEELQRAEELLNEGCSYAEVARTVGRSIRAIRYRFPGRGWSRAEVADFLLALRRAKGVDW